MKKFALLVVFAASLAFAVDAAKPAHSISPSARNSACVPVLAAQMQVDNAATFQIKSDAYKDGMFKGLELGAGGMLLLVGVILEIRKLSRPDTAREKSLTRAASA